MDRIDYCALRRDDFNRSHQACACRHVSFKQTTKHIGDGGNSNRFHCIDRACDLRCAAGKVNAGLLSLDSDAHLDGNFSIAYAIVIKHVCGPVIAVGDRTDSMTHEPGGVFDQVRCIVSRLALTATFDDLQQAPGARFQ